MTGRKTKIDLSDESDRWEWRCPVGHTAWEPTNFHFWCRQCARSWSHNDDIEPEFQQLRNDRTDELVAREDVRLVYGEDAYEHGEGSA